MTDLVIRPLVAGEESLFESMPDPLPELRHVPYPAGVASGGYRPENTWVALRDGRVVARAAWLLPPGSVGAPWLERFDLDAEPEVGAALLRAAHDAFGGPQLYYAAVPAHWRRRPEVLDVVRPPMAAARLAGLIEHGERLRFSWAGTPLPSPSGRYTFRPAVDAAEIRSLVARIAEPDVLTGRETALTVYGVDLATDPLGWLKGPADDWRIALDAGVPVGLVGPAGDACYPLIAYLGLLDAAVRGELLAEAVRALVAGGAREVVADADAHRVAVVADLERTGFRQLRARVVFEPPAGPASGPVPGPASGGRESFRNHRPAHAERTAESQAAFLLPHLRPGLALLDLGCGPGSITVGLAEAVAPGPVTGIDLDPSLPDGADPGITMVTGDVHALPFPDASFDAIYASALLQHLPDPLAVLREARRVARPGAVIGVVDADWDGEVSYPNSPVLERSRAVLRRYREGTSPYVGKELRGLLAEAGFVGCVASARAIAHGDEEETRGFGAFNAALFGAPAAVRRILAEGWATEAELAEFRAAWTAWGDHPGAFVARFWCEALAWAPPR